MRMEKESVGAGGGIVAPGAIAPRSTQGEEPWRDLGVSEAAWRMYRREVAAFAAWCADAGLTAFPTTPRTVVHYLDALAAEGRAPATVERVRAAISVGHEVAFALAREQGLDVPANPTRDLLVRSALRRIKRERARGKRKKRSQARAKREIRLDTLAALVQAAQDNSELVAARDTAVLTVGFWGMLRRSEVVALQAEDMRLVGREGIEIRLRYSKTDQAGKGAIITLARRPRDPLCPVRALIGWLDASGIEHGPIFRRIDRYGNISEEALSAQSVRLIAQRAADASGNANALRVSAHGLRSGAATELAAAGADMREIMAKGRWSSPSVAARYIRLGVSVGNDPMRKIRPGRQRRQR